MLDNTVKPYYLVISTIQSKKRHKNKGCEFMAITLKAARVNKGLTQREAAKTLGISESTLFGYEKGKTKWHYCPNCGKPIRRINK